MSRYYSIEVGANVAAPVPGAGGSGNIGARWTNLLPGGGADPGAQRVEINAPVFAFDEPMSDAGVSVRIWGPTDQQISQAMDFAGSPIMIRGGMMPGLPLATGQAPQAGVLFNGMIFYAFGNNQGLTRTLEFICFPGRSNQATPPNLTFLWKKGQPLATIIQATLKNAFPGYDVDCSISPDLVLGRDESGYYRSLQDFGLFIKGISKNIIGGSYHGVTIALVGNRFRVFDATTTPDNGALNLPSSITIAQQDLIGNVTWINPTSIQFSTVMRADIAQRDQIVLPALAGAHAVASQASALPLRAKPLFQGTWIITQMQHTGDSRDPNPGGWITTFWATTTMPDPVPTGLATKQTTEQTTG